MQKKIYNANSVVKVPADDSYFPILLYPVWFPYHTYRTRSPKKESHMYGVLNEVYL